MKHYVNDTSELRITHNNSSKVGEITIQLGIMNPIVIVKNSAYISGVYDSTTGKKNPGMPYCEIDAKVPTIKDERKAISSSTQNEMTLTLKTKLKQL